jgi:Xaa-Pro aminopeptidase
MVNFSKLQILMEESRLDALITVDPRNSYYLAGYMDPEVWLRDMQDMTMYLPVVSFPDRSFVVGAQIDNHLFPGESYFCEMVLSKRLEMLAEQLAARGLHRSKLGIDLDYTPVNVLNRLTELLPGAEFFAADNLLGKLRSVKSPEELAYIKKAVGIAEGAFLDIKNTIREGSLVADIMTGWAQAVIGRGGYPVAGLPFDFITQSVMSVQEGFKKPGHYIDRLPSKLEAGCTTRFDLSVCYKGYVSDQKIVVCVGEPAPEAVAIYQEHRDRQEFMKSFIKPGMSKREVYDACVENFEHLDEYVFWIHGVGLDVHEEPRVGSLLPSAVDVKQEMTFEVGQVLALEPSWLVEDLYVLSEHGFERLCGLPQQIIALGAK